MMKLRVSYKRLIISSKASDSERGSELVQRLALVGLFCFIHRNGNLFQLVKAVVS